MGQNTESRAATGLRSALAAFLLFGALLLPAPASAQSLGVDFTAPGQSTLANCCFTLGYQFTANTAVSVIGLAVYNSWGIEGTQVDVGLWNTSGTLLSSVTVTQASTVIGAANWVYESITPVALTSGQNYFVAATGTAANYTFDPIGMSTNPQITYVDNAYANDGLLFPSQNTPGFVGWFGANVVLGSAASNIITPQFFLGSTLGTTTNPVFEGGTLQLDQPGTTYAMGFTLDDSLTSTIDQLGLTSTFSGVYSDASSGKPGNITIANSNTGGRVIFTAVNTYTGTTTINAGATLELTGTGSIATSSNVDVNGTFDISTLAAGTSITGLSGGSTGSVLLGGSGSILNITGANALFSGVISGAGGVTVSGGTETFAGINTYTGPTSISAGAILALSGSGSIATSSRLTADGWLDISATTAGASITSLNGASTGQVILGAQTLTITAANDAFAGVISGTGGVTLAAGTQTLTGTNTYTGTTTITAGAVLALSGTGSIATSSGVVANGFLDISATTSGASIKALSGATTGQVVLGAQNLTITAASGTFAGVISGTGGLTLSAGFQTLTGTNTYTGGTTINGGLLQLGNGGTTGSITGNITNNASLMINRSNTTTIAGTISGTGNLVQWGPGTTILTADNTYTGGTLIAFGTLQLGNGGTTGAILGDITNDGILAINRSNALVLSGVISGTGSLTKTGAGQFFLTGANTYTGDTTINGGLLFIGDGGTTGAIAGNIVNNSGLLFNRTDTITYAGVISGTGSTGLSSTGTTILTGANTYTGGTVINSGTLQLGNGGSTGSIVGNVSGSSGTLAFNRADTVTFAGTISGAIALAQNGPGTTILTADNSYTGGTTINAGTLQLGNGDLHGAVIGDIVNNAALVFNRANNLTMAGVISGTGTVTKTGVGTVIITGNNTYTGGTTITAGALQIGDSNGIGAIVGNIVDNASLVFNRNNTLTMAGNISGTGSLTQAGVGTTILSGTNSYTGGTTISGGTLQIDSPNAITGDVTNNAALLFNSNSLTVATGVISGRGTVTSNGVTVFTGANTYTGGTTINSGRLLALGFGGTTGSITGDVTNNGSLYFYRTDTVTFPGVVSGTGTLLQLGTGTTILTGTNTYTGGTVIFAGTLQIGNGGTVGSILGDINNSGALIYNHSDTVTMNNIISGDGGTLTQAGTGKLILNAANTYTGLTTIAAGSLMVGDAAHPGAVVSGAVTLGAGTLLQGHGTILGAVTNTSTGTVAPGGSIGTLTVGSYTQGPAATFAVEASPTVASKLVSTGAASLDGTAAITFNAGTYTTKSYQILTGAPVTGRFSTATMTNTPASYVAGLYYNPNNTEVDLLLADTRSATIYSNMNTQALNNGQSFATSMLRMLSATSTCTANGTIANNGATMSGANQTACTQGTRAWMTPFVGAATMGNAGGKGFDSTTAGIAGGVDRTFDMGATIGFAGQYSQDRINASADASHAQLTSYHLGVYGRLPVGDLKLDAAAFYATNTSSVSRDTNGAGFARAAPNGHGAGAALQVSYDLLGGDIAPYAGIRYFNYSRQGATETNVGPLGFAIQSNTLTSVRADIGVRLQHSYQVGAVKLTPQVWLGLEQEFGSTRNATNGSLANALGTSFSVSPKAIDRTMATAEIRLGAALSDSLQVYVDLNGRAGNAARQGTAVLGGQLRF